MRGPWRRSCVLVCCGVLGSCARGASADQLRARAAFDFNCSKDTVEIFELDERTAGVRACGKQGTYIESCSSPSESRDTCTWVLNTDSTPSDSAPMEAT